MVDGTAACRRRLAAATLAVCAAAFTVLVLAASPAAAHAALVSSTPADGTVLTAAPTEVTLTFGEPVRAAPEGVAVIGPDGDRADDGVVRRAGAAVLAMRLPGLRVRARGGTYTVTWRVISADSHPVGGAFTFSIGAPSRVAHVRPARASRALGLAFGLTRFAGFAGFIVLVGAAALCGYGGSWVAARGGIRRLLVAAWAVSAVATGAAMLLAGPYAAGRDLAGVFDAGLVRQTLHDRYGAALAARTVLLGIVPAVLVWAAGTPATGARRERIAGRPGLRWVLAAVSGGLIAAGLAATWSVAGHAGAGAHDAIAMTADVPHLLAAALWVGGLVALPVLLRHPELGRATAGRFSRVAVGCVLVLVATGLVQAWLRVETPAAVFTTAYGRLLAAKVAVLGLVLLAARRVRARLRGADGRRPGRMLAVETAGAASVLALTAVLVQSPPAAQAYAARPATRSVRFQAGGDSGRLTVRLPNAARGLGRGDLTVRAPDRRARDVPQITASWTLPRLAIGPLPARLTRTGTGRFAASWPPLPAAGPWRLSVTIRTSEIDETTVRAELRIR
ncbi:copper resistance protein CopC [Actinoallomurus sp. NPDC052308]|uniref:copper resistance protein CopC n=1 Tax=Actinoallomurus sp. NPDC052308 TaxID=3155530 RepID=UPI0034337E44